MVASADISTRALKRALDGVWLPVLALTEDGHLDLPPDLAPEVAAAITVVALGSERPDIANRTLLLVVDDVAELRRAVSRLGGPWSARVVVVVVRRAKSALTLRPQPEWGGVERVEAVLADGAAVTTIELARRGPTDVVLAALARAAVPMRISGPEGLRVAASGAAVPAADATIVHAYDSEAKVPAGLVIGGVAGPFAESAVLGRAPSWVDPPVPGPIDEGVFNPTGFPRTPSGAPLDLDPRARLSAELVGALRAAPHVRVDWPTPLELVAGLAMTGTVLVSGPVPAQARAALGDAVADALQAPVPLAAEPDHDLRREECSVRLRRAALIAHSGAGWRERVAGGKGRPATGYSSVSILLPTRRPEQLEFALGQVARLRRTLPGADVELVLATHGFDPDRGRVADLLGGRAHQVVPVPSDAILGEVLRAACDAASGELVMKMDDDDWYGPDIVTDLLLARRYSGADLVGMPAEIVRLESRDLTLRRKGPSENHGSFVAGGTLLLDRTLLRGLGGFRPLRLHEDARLLHSLKAAGGTIYRTHGLGYVLRRRATGHTWDPGDDYFLRPETLVAQWPGFRPSALVEAP